MLRTIISNLKKLKEIWIEEEKSTLSLIPCYQAWDIGSMRLALGAFATTRFISKDRLILSNYGHK